MICETVKPAVFFGEDSEIASSAIRVQEALAGLIEGHDAVQEAEISMHCRSGINLPGYYRPTVRWPIAVYAESAVAAVVWAVIDSWPFLAKNWCGFRPLLIP